MKKILGLALLATVFTTSAFASVARLEALGEDQYGSQYLNDNRNMFLNAAAVNDHFDFVTFEWGDTTKFQNTEEAGTFSNQGSKAQGGVFRKSGDMVYGVYFGADSNTASQLRASGLASLYATGAFGANPNPTTPGLAEGVISNLLSLVQNENTLDLFVGGESTFKWGAKLSYANSQNEQGYDGSQADADEVNKTGILVGLGAIAGKNEFYANIGAGNELEIKNIQVAANPAATINGQDYHFKGQIGYQVGYVRALGNNAKAWLEYRQQDTEEEEIDALGETMEVQIIQVGYGKVSKLNDVFTANYKLVYASDRQENRGFRDVEDYEESKLRATLGMEAMVKEWLTIRASISNNVFGTTTLASNGLSVSKDERTIADSTDVRLGATLAFGDFGIDGLIGNNADGDGVVAEDGDDNGTIRTDSLMSRVSMTYKF